MREQQQLTIIPMEDPIIHTDDHPFCGDPTCPCAEDPELLAELAHQVEDGLLTPCRGHQHRERQDALVGERAGVTSSGNSRATD